MHAPSQINVKNIDKFIASFWIGVAADGCKESRYIDVGPDNAVEDPFDAEVGDALEAFFEGVFVCNCDCVAGG